LAWPFGGLSSLDKLAQRFRPCKVPASTPFAFTFTSVPVVACASCTALSPAAHPYTTSTYLPSLPLLTCSPALPCHLRCWLCRPLRRHHRCCCYLSKGQRSSTGDTVMDTATATTSKDVVVSPYHKWPPKPLSTALVLVSTLYFQTRRLLFSSITSFASLQSRPTYHYLPNP
jgi:hypothetical protein